MSNMRLTWNGQRITRRVKQVAERAQYEGAEMILAKSKDVVPHATGTLQRSGTVSPPNPSDVHYISYNTPYARKQHEDLTLRHPDPTNPISSSGRTAKYLERPFEELKQRVTRHIGNAIERELAGGG